VWICAIIPSLALLYFSLEIILGLKPLGSVSAHEPLRAAVLIPAHNEAILIGEAVRKVRRQIHPNTQILVVADNCSDMTATQARAAGATVLERHQASHRGKGYALAFARDALARSPPDAVFVLDADCEVSKGSVEAMCAHACARGEPVQGQNLLHAAPGSSPLVLLSNFAMLVRNLVRARGLYRLGGGTALFGTGMAFPWAVFSDLDLATSETAEDLALALSLALKGVKIHLYEDLAVTSVAAELEDSLDQRRRWEHGFLSNALAYALPLLAQGTLRRSRHLLALGADMLIPPISLLFVAALGALVPTIMLAALRGVDGPAVLLAVALAGAAVCVAVAWYAEGQALIGLRSLARAPFYILWKIPLYIGFFTARQREWNRTRRVNEQNADASATRSKK
jgi:cellulose synthase/poly-beta-1,6-N-acetylglucosamine synthase-like glycosyltransferase